MKTLLSLVLCISFLAVPISAKKAAILSSALLSGGKKRTYSLYVPQTLPVNQAVPLVVTLHGSGDRGRLMVEKWRDLADSKGFILLGPDSLDSAGWWTPQDGPEYLYDVVQEVKSQYHIDDRRVYLFGHSGGAIFGISMGLFEPEYFAAVAVHAGAIEIERMQPLMNQAPRKIPMMLFVGANDPLFPIADVTETRDALKKKGFPVQMVVLPDHDHDYIARAREVNQKAWNFFAGVTLQGPLRYTPYRF